MSDPTRPVQWTLGGLPATCRTCLYFRGYPNGSYCFRPRGGARVVASPDVTCERWRPAVEALPAEQNDEEVH
ncbi:MAG TPA: hypothetical protein VM537_02920 [Anaerolineae bacterium]|nr:hypothetical protein [Anaerolineae bacterium]